MGSSKCFTPVRGRAMRVTKLDGCGQPVYGDSSVGVTKGFVTISFTANTDEGEEINVTNANGETCVRETPCPSFLGYGVEIEFCQVDPAILAILTGQETVADDDDVQVGFRVNSDNSVCDSGFALEVWTGTPGVQCDPSSVGNAAAQQGGYLLLPYMQGGVFGDFTIENAAISFTLTGAATKTGSGWGVGPYDVVPNGGAPGPLMKPISSGDHLHVQVTDVAPPEASCGTKPLLDPDGAALTGVTVTTSGLSAQFTPAPAGTDPWWVDFGDGTWDFAEEGATLDHVYDFPGDYTITAHRGASQIEQVVTVAADTGAEPTVSAIAPTSGVAAGGTPVTITGTSFEA